MRKPKPNDTNQIKMMENETNQNKLHFFKAQIGEKFLHIPSFQLWGERLKTRKLLLEML